MNCLRHDNQEHSHREARLSGRMPQIAPLRFAVRQTQCIAPRAHSALAQKRSNCLAAHWGCNSIHGVRSTRIHDGFAVNSWRSQFIYKTRARTKGKKSFHSCSLLLYRACREGGSMSRTQYETLSLFSTLTLIIRL